jgi:DNA-binding MarR family transcriptional regulator
MTRTSAEVARTALDLRIAIGRIARRIRQIYATAESATDPSFIEVSVLLRLDRHGPLTSRALAEIESVTPQAIGTALSSLERRGLVARSRDPSDGRKVITAITEAGRGVLASREHAMNEHMTTAFRDGFDAAERRQLAAVIPLLERFANEL